MKIRKLDVRDIEGFHIGNAEDVEGGTGVTVIVSEEGAVAGVDVRGGAPATRETDLLRSENTVDSINAVVLSGGSAFGLEAASGVMRALAAREIGFRDGEIVVPIVTGASLYDLRCGKSDVFPDREMGVKAVSNAFEGRFRSGNYGAGTGATVGKMFGMDRAMKSGLGSFACGDDVIQVGAVVAVNACADIYNGAGNIIAGLRTEDGTAIHGTIKALKDQVHNVTGRREATLEELREKTARKAEINRKRLSQADEFFPAYPNTEDASEFSEDADSAAVGPIDSIQSGFGSDAGQQEAVKTEAAEDIGNISDTINNAQTRSDIAKAIMQAYMNSSLQTSGGAEQAGSVNEVSSDADAAADNIYGEDTGTVEQSAYTTEAEYPSGEDFGAAAEENTKAVNEPDTYADVPEYGSDVSGSDPASDYNTAASELSEHAEAVSADPEPDLFELSEEEKADMGYGIPFNTTIGCLITNACLTKPQANKLASILHDAYARAIKPVHGTMDGDTIFVMSTGKEEVNFDAFAALATDVMQYAIIDAAISSESAYGFPSASAMSRAVAAAGQESSEQ
ncbi:MAG: hypothetical protein E7220_05950 [Clostridiales bacterium]|nr:hypothetical protein [Clostridiales bacterium]